MSPDRPVHAIRRSVALSRMNHVVCLRLTGRDGFQTLDRLLPAELFVREGKMLHTLVLDEHARPRADVYICCDGEDFFLLAEGLPGEELRRLVLDHRPPGGDLTVELLDPSHRIFSLGGPYAWETLAVLAGPEVIGMPFLTFAHLDELICFRAGKTGEYGYDLLVPAEQSEAIWSRLLEAGRRFDLEIADRELLDLCALENWFFNIRREGRADVTPIELQLQWRVCHRKEYLGSAALAERRRAGPSSRLVCLISGAPLAAGDALVYEDRSVGTLVNAGFSSARGDHVALALVDTAWAYSGIDCLAVHRKNASVPVRTVSPPVLNNRSLYVSPQVHSYFARSEMKFPPWVGRIPAWTSQNER